MNNILKTSVLATLFFSLTGITAHAQDIYGEATYMSKTQIDKSWMDGNRDITPEMRKRMEENFKKMSEKTFTLKFDRSQAVYTEELALSAPGGGGGGWGAMMGTMMAGEKHKDITNGTYTEQRDMMGKTFLIQDELPKLEWKITGEQRKIGNYTAIKATATKPVTDLDWAQFRRRDNKDKDAEQKKKDSIAAASGDMKLTDMFEKPSTVEITAWFTPEIPVQHGPAEYGGLPGLILEVSDGKTILLLSEIKLNPKDRTELKAAKKGEKVTQAEYDATLKVKMEEMSQRWRGGGRGRG